jgi:hypothetical protein
MIGHLDRLGRYRMAYAKLFSTITESSLWSASKDARLLFMSMLAKADQVGYVEAALPGLARIANLTLAETEAALAELMAPDPYSKSPDCDGARVVKVDRGWCLVNYEAYRERQDGDAKREYMRNYMRDYRAKGKPVNVGKEKLDGVGQAEAEAEAKAEREGERPAAVKLTLEDDLVAASVKMTRNGEDLYPEWQKACKGLQPAQVRAILAEARPGIEWPSEFKAHRAQRGI